MLWLWHNLFFSSCCPSSGLGADSSVRYCVDNLPLPQGLAHQTAAPSISQCKPSVIPPSFFYTVWISDYALHNAEPDLNPDLLHRSSTGNFLPITCIELTHNSSNWLCEPGVWHEFTVFSGIIGVLLVVQNICSKEKVNR